MSSERKGLNVQLSQQAKPMAGFSLPEVMMSLLLSSILFLLLTQLYISIKQEYQKISVSLERHMEQQWVSDLLRDRIKRAGFTPCLSLKYLNNAEHFQPILIDNEHQSLTTQRMSERFDLIITVFSPTQLLTHGHVIKSKQQILLADCYHAELSSIKTIQTFEEGSLITLSKPLHFEYQHPIFIGEWMQETFYIHQQGTHPSSLHYQWHRADELTPLFSAMRIKHKSNQLIQLILEQHHAPTLSLETWIRA